MLEVAELAAEAALTTSEEEKVGLENRLARSAQALLQARPFPVRVEKTPHSWLVTDFWTQWQAICYRAAGNTRPKSACGRPHWSTSGLA